MKPIVLIITSLVIVAGVITVLKALKSKKTSTPVVDIFPEIIIEEVNVVEPEVKEVVKATSKKKSTSTKAKKHTDKI